MKSLQITGVQSLESKLKFDCINTRSRQRYTFNVTHYDSYFSKIVVDHDRWGNSGQKITKSSPDTNQQIMSKWTRFLIQITSLI